MMGSFSLRYILLLLLIQVYTNCVALSPDYFSSPDTSLRVIAHRGGAAHGPENTLPLIKKTLDYNITGIEIDVRVTKDSVLVLMHDKTINRTTNGRGRVANFCFEELRTFDSGSWFSSEFSGTQIPALSEVIELINGRKELFIEIKGSERIHPGISRAVANIILQYGAEEWCVVQSFNSKILFNIRNEYPQIRIQKLIVFKLPLLPLAVDNKLSVFTFRRFHFAETINPHFRFTSKHLVRKAQKRNMGINIWGGKNRDAYKRKMHLPAIGIITDFPELENIVE